MRYVRARLIEYNRDLAYRVFMSDCAHHLVGTQSRWAEIVINVEKPQPEKKEETAEEIVNRIKSGLMG